MKSQKHLIVIAFVAAAVSSQVARAQRVNWTQARLTAQDIAEDAQRAYVESSRTIGGELARRFFTAWADAEALSTLAQGAPSTQREVMEAVSFLDADFEAANDLMRRSRLTGDARAYFVHATDELDHFKEQVGMGGPPPEDPPPQTALSLTLASDGWHGNFFDRYTRLAGEFKGLNLRQADIIVTDAQGYSLWHRDNAFPEIREFYDTHKFFRPAVVTIPFQQKFYLKWIPPGAAWVYVRLRDGAGNVSDQAIPVPQ
ncbi:MAG: hypothetical protein U0166_25600 [Acidobacteriota bacterium]